jgi:hypothetical protein
VSSYTTAASYTLRGFPLLALVATLLVVGVLSMPNRLGHIDAATSSTSHRHTPAWLDRAARLDLRYGCSHTGLAPGVIPAHAVVKVGRRARLTSFDEGWAMHLQQRPGTLISVCAR